MKKIPIIILGVVTLSGVITNENIVTQIVCGIMCLSSILLYAVISKK